MLVRLAADGSARRREEGGALVLGAPLGLEHVHGDFVLAGEEQARQVDVVLLRWETMIKSREPGRITFPLGPLGRLSGGSAALSAQRFYPANNVNDFFFFFHRCFHM